MLAQYRKRGNLKICDLHILCKDHLFEKHSPILQKTLKLKLKVTKTVYLGKPELDMNCLSSTGADKFFSRRPTFRARKKRWSKPKSTSNRDTTKNIAFCYLLAKQDLQLSF